MFDPDFDGAIFSQAWRDPLWGNRLTNRNSITLNRGTEFTLISRDHRSGNMVDGIDIPLAKIFTLWRFLI